HKWWNGSSWSQWEDLGGGPISSAPAAASTGNNRLEVFARGRNNQLLFRTWNGSRWSGWQSLDGVLTSEPAAVSWGGNRLDVFVRGQNNHLWHIWRP
ncbi:MAG: insect kinin peptide, partial [Clostridia bacterium]|nr:insect kinin peptide [Clostridia bacterium]